VDVVEMEGIDHKVLLKYNVYVQPNSSYAKIHFIAL